MMVLCVRSFFKVIRIWFICGYVGFGNNFGGDVEF